MWWSRIVVTARVAATLWVAAIGIVTVLQLNGLVPQLPKLEPYVWVVSLVIIAVDNVGSLFTRRYRTKRAARDAGIEKALMSLLINLAKSGDLRFEELGASVYVPSRWDRFLRRGGNARRLNRIVRFRPAGYPQQSGVAWTPAKGAVGECWKLKKTVCRNANAVARRWGSSELSPEGFNRLPTGTTQGFSYEEFVAIAGKYSEIVAEPVWHSGKERTIVGVLAIDRSYIARDASFTVKLGKTSTLEITAATASVVGGILSPKSDDA